MKKSNSCFKDKSEGMTTRTDTAAERNNLSGKHYSTRDAVMGREMGGGSDYLGHSVTDAGKVKKI